LRKLAEKIKEAKKKGEEVKKNVEELNKELKRIEDLVKAIEGDRETISKLEKELFDELFSQIEKAAEKANKSVQGAGATGLQGALMFIKWAKFVLENGGKAAKAFEALVTPRNACTICERESLGRESGGGRPRRWVAKRKLPVTIGTFFFHYTAKWTVLCDNSRRVPSGCRGVWATAPTKDFDQQWIPCD